MMYDGIKFRRNSSIVEIKNPDKTRSSYCTFGRLVKQGTYEDDIPTVASVLVDHMTWPDGAPVYAIPILPLHHYKTNLAVKTTNHRNGDQTMEQFLKVDGICYSKKVKFISVK